LLAGDEVGPGLADLPPAWLLLPRTGADEARRISERLRDHIASEPIAIGSGTQADFVFRLTICVGIAVLNSSRRALGELMGAADAALDQARRTGWNRVFVMPDGAAEAPDSWPRQFRQDSPGQGRFRPRR